MGQRYILFFAQIHDDFRIPEVEALDEALGLGLELEDGYDVSRPFMTVNLPSESEARRLGSRASLVREVIEYWADAATLEDLHDRNRANRSKWESHIPSASFRVTPVGYKTTFSTARRRQLIDGLAYLDFQGPIDLKTPDVEIFLAEEHEDCEMEEADDQGPLQPGKHPTRSKHFWLGRKICEGRRDLTDLFDLKKRAYIGNTSMESSLSVLMANQAQVGPGHIVLDPFCGTGSMLYPAAFFGAVVFGSDIDGRPMRGRGSKSIRDSARQYGVDEKLLDFAVFDMTQHPWRTGGIFDAIITDPPYGVRAGAKRLGRVNEDKLRQEAYILPSGEKSHELDDYIPPTKPWEMSEVLEYLLQYSVFLLKPGGRLVYWLPTTSSDYRAEDVPQLAGLTLVANSCQDFGRWQRRLITMVKVSDEPERSELATPATNAAGRRVPAHRNFRDQYYMGFKGAPSSAPAPENLKDIPALP